MSVHDDEIHTILDEICTSLLAMPVASAVPHQPHDEHYLTGCVTITGGWDGAVTIGCTASFARHVAGVMFDTDPDDLAPDEVRDAIGEITNMAGGNIKSLLPGPSRLSLPAVADGVDAVFAIPGGTITNRVGLDCGGHNVVVTVFRGDHPLG